MKKTVNILLVVSLACSLILGIVLFGHYQAVQKGRTDLYRSVVGICGTAALRLDESLKTNDREALHTLAGTLLVQAGRLDAPLSHTYGVSYKAVNGILACSFLFVPIDELGLPPIGRQTKDYTPFTQQEIEILQALRDALRDCVDTLETHKEGDIDALNQALEELARVVNPIRGIYNYE